MTPDLAIFRFALEELASAGRRVAHRLRRMPASGIYGDDHRHRTLWDEFCFEQENGPTFQLEWAWVETLHPILVEVVERLPEHTARLLSWHLASLDDNDPDDSVWPDMLRSAVLDGAKEVACRR